jgi:hypothetical protein
MNALLSPASAAAGRMREAIKGAINEARMLHSDGSLFVDADSSGRAAVIARAADDRHALVLYEDGGGASSRRRPDLAPPDGYELSQSRAIAASTSERTNRRWRPSLSDGSRPRRA